MTTQEILKVIEDTNMVDAPKKLKVFLFLLCMSIENRNVMRINQTEVAEKLNISRCTVNRTFKQLLESGNIGRNTMNGYYFRSKVNQYIKEEFPESEHKESAKEIDAEDLKYKDSKLKEREKNSFVSKKEVVPEEKLLTKKVEDKVKKQDVKQDVKQEEMVKFSSESQSELDSKKENENSVDMSRYDNFLK